MKRFTKKRLESVFDGVYLFCLITVIVGFFLPWVGDCSGYELGSYAEGLSAFKIWAVIGFIAVGAVFMFARFRFVQLVLILLGTINLLWFFLDEVGGDADDIGYGWWITVAAYVVAVIVSASSAAKYGKKQNVANEFKKKK